MGQHFLVIADRQTPWKVKGDEMKKCARNEIAIHEKDDYYDGWHITLAGEPDYLIRSCMAEQLVAIILGFGIGIYE